MILGGLQKNGDRRTIGGVGGPMMSLLLLWAPRIILDVLGDCKVVSPLVNFSRHHGVGKVMPNKNTSVSWSKIFENQSRKRIKCRTK